MQLGQFGESVHGRCAALPGAAPTAAFVPAWLPALSYDAEADAWRVNAFGPDADEDSLTTSACSSEPSSRAPAGCACAVRTAWARGRRGARR